MGAADGKFFGGKSHLIGGRRESNPRASFTSWIQRSRAAPRSAESLKIWRSASIPLATGLKFAFLRTGRTRGTHAAHWYSIHLRPLERQRKRSAGGSAVCLAAAVGQIQRHSSAHRRALADRHGALVDPCADGAHPPFPRQRKHWNRPGPLRAPGAGCLDRRFANRGRVFPGFARHGDLPGHRCFAVPGTTQSAPAGS